MEADIHISQLVNTLKDIDQNQSHENWRLISGHSGKVRKNDLKASKLLHGASHVKIQHQGLVNGEGAVGVRAGEMAIDNITMHLKGKVPKETPGRHSRLRGKGQERPRGPENNSMKTKKFKQSRNRVKTEEKPTIPKTNIDLSSATTTVKSLKSPLASICWIPCRAFTHWGRRVRRKRASPLSGVSERSLVTKILGQAQPPQP